MPTRTFIGLIFLVLALMVASTPALLNPAASGLREGLAAAGVPGMASDDGVTRDKRKDTGSVKNKLVLQGYERGKTDMKDTQPVGERGQQLPGGRLVSGSRRALLPGESLPYDPKSPPVTSKNGVLLDALNCPVFRDGVDIVTLWKDPAQKKKYTDKANAADNPKACIALLKNRVAAATNATLIDSNNLRDAVQLANTNDLGTSILGDYWTIMDYVFPAAEFGSGSIYTRESARDVLASVAAETRAK